MNSQGYENQYFCLGTHTRLWTAACSLENTVLGILWRIVTPSTSYYTLDTFMSSFLNRATKLFVVMQLLAFHMVNSVIIQNAGASTLIFNSVNDQKKEMHNLTSARWNPTFGLTWRMHALKLFIIIVSWNFFPWERILEKIWTKAPYSMYVHSYNYNYCCSQLQYVT